MNGKEQLWSILEPLIREEGLELYDLQVPPARHGTLRVFLWTAQRAEAAEASGVKLAQCTRISRKISSFREVNPDVIESEWLIEVSSPGINRSLTRPEHFQNAVGERVSVKVHGSNTPVVLGTLSNVRDNAVYLRESSGASERIVPLSDIREAHVDYDFSQT